MTDEEHGMLVAIYSQLSGSPTLGQWPGWPSWGGGTDESLTMVDYLRRTNVEVRQTWNAIKTIQTKLDSFSVSPAGDLGSLSQSDVNRIAGAVVSMLSQKLASP